MKDLFFTSDLSAVFRQDKYYGVEKNVAKALHKLGVHYNERTENSEQMIRKLAIHLIEQRGETESFLTETFIYPEAVLKLLKEKGLPLPAALRPATTTAAKKPTVQEQFEKNFDRVCRNCGTVSDPLGTTYRTPIGRLIFRTYLETLQSQGVKPTAWYVLTHLKEFDTEKIVTAVEDDYVTWKTGDGKEKLTSLHTIGKFILVLDREAKKLLGR